MVLYVVVEFLVEEGAVGIVCDSWIEKNGQVCHDIFLPIKCFQN